MKDKNIIIVFVITTVLLAISLVSYSANAYKVDIYGRNFYHRLAESLSKGHLYIDEKVDSKLKELSNPYDPIERGRRSVKYLIDYSFYNNHYYVYFGIVPVLMTYLPYRIITGNDLLSYHATQLFVIIYIVGLFMLLKKIMDLFFKDMPLPLFLLFSFTLSFISIWNIIFKPSIYYTVIMAGISFAIWSIYFWVRACFDDVSEKKQLLFLTLGSFFGALVFGCRPPIGFFNLLIIPVFIIMLRKEDINRKRVSKLLLTLLPYVIVFGLLFLYNYLRFDSPFEFGKTYQLTIYDPIKYDWSKNFSIERLLKVLNFFTFSIYKKASFENYGLFIIFPVLLLNFLFLKKSVRKELKENKLFLFVITLFISFIIIGLLDIVFNFRVIQRYRMDVCWILALGCFICSGMCRNTVKNKKIFDILLCIIIIITLIVFVVFLLMFLKIIPILLSLE